MKKLCLIVLFMLFGCGEKDNVEVAIFESADVANKVIILLSRHQISATLTVTKEHQLVFVSTDDLVKARQLLTKYNFYFEPQDLNDLLESKFASLSKLEMVKGNLIESRVIYNKLSLIPNVLRTSVIVTGDKSKRMSVIILSLDEMELRSKNNIERFLNGLISEADSITVSYFFQNINNEKT